MLGVVEMNRPVKGPDQQLDLIHSPRSSGWLLVASRLRRMESCWPLASGGESDRLSGPISMQQRCHGLAEWQWCSGQLQIRTLLLHRRSKCA